MQNKSDVQVSVILNEAKRSEESHEILRLEKQPQDDDKGKKICTRCKITNDQETRYKQNSNFNSQFSNLNIGVGY